MPLLEMLTLLSIKLKQLPELSLYVSGPNHAHKTSLQPRDIVGASRGERRRGKCKARAASRAAPPRCTSRGTGAQLRKAVTCRCKKSVWLRPRDHCRGHDHKAQPRDTANSTVALSRFVSPSPQPPLGLRRFRAPFVMHVSGEMSSPGRAAGRRSR